jgi:hypothetical protein
MELFFDHLRTGDVTMSQLCDVCSSFSGILSVTGIWTKPLARRTLPRARNEGALKGFQSRKRLRENQSYVTMSAIPRRSVHGNIDPYLLFSTNPLVTRVSRTKIDCNPIAKPASAANASGLVQISLSQMPRRDTIVVSPGSSAPAHLR